MYVRGTKAWITREACKTSRQSIVPLWCKCEKMSRNWRKGVFSRPCITFPRPHPPRAKTATCSERDVRWCGYSAGCRLTSELKKKTLWVQKVQLSFAFSPIFINHFRYFIRKLESTVSSVMSHVSPANFQALDQRVSRSRKMPVEVRQRHMANANGVYMFPTIS